MGWSRNEPMYDVVVFVIGMMLTRHWWSVTPRSKNVNVTRRCWISQVTRVILEKANRRLSEVEAKQRMDFSPSLRCKRGKKEKRSFTPLSAYLKDAIEEGKKGKGTVTRTGLRTSAKRVPLNLSHRNVKSCNLVAKKEETKCIAT
ncbi:hypothetical protein E6C27_scaffold79G00690 [Cucumis melo var. makuwa]|uniref:Uncharacterized protein n=1 Tax=Cucumis melo var. makuwa TaxID=1194695 RepID=A0A5A7V4S2_CUCMM|nr:hypothetical protein E6C27_scaffold79G00690 [Cucumis melo var. makuwa]